MDSSLKKRNGIGGQDGELTQDGTSVDSDAAAPADVSETSKLIENTGYADDPKVESIDDALSAIGLGPFQWRLFAMTSVAAMFLTAEMLKLSVILPVIKDYWKLPNMQLAFFVSVANLGTGTGALVFGYLADRFGRHRVYIASFFVLAFFALLQLISPNIYIFSFCRFFMGTAYGANQVEQWVLLSELMPAKHRARLMMGVESFTGIGVMFTVLLAWVLEDALRWRVVILITSIPPLFLGFVFFYFLPSSPQYLASLGDVQSARKILERIAQENKASDAVAKKIQQLNLHGLNNRDAMGELSFQQLFRPLLRRLTILLLLIWIFGVAATRTLMWVPLYLKEHPELAGSNSRLLQVYETAFMMAAGDTAGPLLALIVVNVVDRRNLLSFVLIFLGFLALIMGCIMNAMVLMCLLPLATAAARAAVITVSIYTSESYPTIIRSTAMGFFVAAEWILIIFMHWIIALVLGSPFYVFTSILVGQIVIALIASLMLPFDTRFASLASHFYQEYSKLHSAATADSNKASARYRD